jgi:site-specific DNA recombinase
MTKKKISKAQTKTQSFRIAIYVRVSTEEQAENPEGSIKNQEMRLREYIKLKNMVEPFGEVEAVFSDPGVSAKDMNRPAFQKMLRAIERREIDLVLVTELSRFSRSTKDFAMLQDFLEEHSCKFMSIRENFDTSGAAGSMVLSLMASIAEFERRQTAERISHSFLARAKRGLYNGGSIPLGYKVEASQPGTLVVVPEEARLVNLFFDTFLKEQTLAATAKRLNADGIRIPREMRGGGAVRGKSVKFDQVYRILRNKAYLGVRVFQSKNGWEEVPALWEPIVDQAKFERVQKILEHNSTRAIARAVSAPKSGLAV